MKRMKQKDWINALKFCCPVCRSTEIDSTGMFDAHHYEQLCRNCGQTFIEIMKVTGYKLVPQSEESECAIALRKDLESFGVL